MPNRTDFGSLTWNLDAMVEGKRTLQEFLGGRVKLVNFLGMDMAGMAPDIRTFPLPDARGGQGWTVMQPFVETLLHQPLTTSFMVFDIWPEHFTITIKSCMQFPRRRCAARSAGSSVGSSIAIAGPWGRVVRGRRAFCGGG